MKMRDNDEHSQNATRACSINIGEDEHDRKKKNFLQCRLRNLHSIEDNEETAVFFLSKIECLENMDFIC